MGPSLTIDIRDKRFGTPLFTDFALSVAPGTVLALVGPSGVGKSTLLRMIGGIDSSFRGSITVDGAPAAQAPPPGFVFQDPRLLPWLSARDNILVVHPSISRAAADDGLRRVGLAGSEEAFPHQLSGGMQRRVALARAFAGSPRLLLLDEPFVSLDRNLVRELASLLGELLAASRATAILVTHQPDDAAMLADQAVLLAGRPVRIVADLALPGDRGTRSPEAVDRIAGELAAAAAAHSVG